MDTQLKGTLYTLASAAFFGAEAVFVKTAYAEGLSPLTITTGRFVIAATLLGPTFVKYVLRNRLSSRTFLALAATGTFLVAPVTLLVVLSLQHVPASVTIMCLYIYPSLATLLAAPLLKEPLTPSKLLSLALALAGVALVAWTPGASPVQAGGSCSALAGIGLALAAAVVNACGIVAVKKNLAGLPPMVVTGGAIASGSLLYGALAWPLRASFAMTGRAFMSLLVLSVVSTAAAYASLYTGLSLIEASRAAIISAFEPVVTVILAGVFLGERLGALQMAGGLLIIASVLVLSRPSPARRAAHREQPM